MNRESSPRGRPGYPYNADGSHWYRAHLPDEDCPDKSAFGIGLVLGSKDSLTVKQEKLLKIDAIFSAITSRHRIYETPPPFESDEQREQAVQRVIEDIKDFLVKNHPQTPTGWINAWVSALVVNPPEFPAIRLPFTLGHISIFTSGRLDNTKSSDKFGRNANQVQGTSRASQPVNFSRLRKRNSLIATARPLATADQAANIEFDANTISVQEQREKISILRRMFPTGQLPPFQKAEQTLLECRGDIETAYLKLGGKPKDARNIASVSQRSTILGSFRGAGMSSRSSTPSKAASVGPLKVPITPSPQKRLGSSSKSVASTAPTEEITPQSFANSPSSPTKRSRFSLKTPASKVASLTSPTPIKSPQKSVSGPKAALTTLVSSKKSEGKPKTKEAADQFHELFEVVDRTAYRSGGKIEDNIDSILSSVAEDYPPGFAQAFKDLKPDIRSSEQQAQFDYEDDFYVSTDSKDILAPLKDLQNEVAVTQVKPPREGEGLSLWEQCCLLFQIEPQKTEVNEMVAIAGLKHPLYQFQAFAVYWQMVTSRSMGGGFVADAPGLGKTLEFMALLVVERQLCILKAELAESLSKGNSKKNIGLTADGKHLNDEPHQSLDICPSLKMRPGWIKCPCMKSSPAYRLDPIPGVRLAVVPEALMTNWRKEWDTHIDLDSELDMRLLLAHQGSQVNSKIKEMAYDPGNVNMLKASFPRNNDTQNNARAGQERFLVLTTAVAYETWIRKFEYRKSGSALMNTLKHGKDVKKLQIAFGIACGDECHENFRIGKGVGGVLAGLPGKKVIVWGLTGTPIENTIRSLEGILYALESQYDKDHKSSDSPWTRDEKLKPFRREIFDNLCKEVERETKSKRKSSAATIADFKNRFLPFLTEFMIRRTSESIWQGHSLIPLKPMLHQDIILGHNAKFDKDIQAMQPQFDAIISNTLREKQRLWKINRPGEPFPTELSFNDTVTLLYKQKILATCPALVNLTTGPSAMTLMWDELEKWNSSENSSPYSKNLTEIVTHSPKLLWLRKFLIDLDNSKDVHGDEQKVVIVSQFSSICLIVKLMIERYIPLKAGRVGLVKPKQATRDVAIILESFNDDVHIDKQNKIVRKQKHNFQYLVGPIRQLGRGLQLTRACNIVLMEPDHKYDHELQAFARINRIGQKNHIAFSYRLLDADSKIEQDIVVRQMENNETPGPLVKDARRMRLYEDEKGIVDDEYLYDLVRGDYQQEQSQDQQPDAKARSDSDALLPGDAFLLPNVATRDLSSKVDEAAKRTTLPISPSDANYTLPATSYKMPPDEGFVHGIQAEDEEVFSTKSVSQERAVGGTSFLYDDEDME